MENKKFSLEPRGRPQEGSLKNGNTVHVSDTKFQRKLGG